MEQKIKILVTGDVNGNFKQIFNRIESINKKSGPFDLVLCVGEFFSSSETNDELQAYKNNFKHVPVPTYILGSGNENTLKYFDDLENNEICENLTYLGKRGLYTLTSGVKIAYLSGLEKTPDSSNNDSNENNSIYFNKNDIELVRNSCIISKSQSDYRGIDILLTSQWPDGIEINNKKIENGSKLISYLVKEIRPRYHFCGLNGIYYEPPPFRISADNTTQLELATRFLSLSDVGNTKKEKYIYALNLIPVLKMRILELVQKTTNEITCPYEDMNFSNIKRKSANESGSQYFYDLNTPENHHKRKFQHKKQRMEIDQEKCWFCLSSPDVEKHLIITIGENFYLALAKGSINKYHILILSVTHIPCASLLTTEDWEELEKIKKSLRDFYKSKGKSICFFERNYKSAHLQINAIGIDEEYEWKIKHSFEDKSDEYKLDLQSIPKFEEPTDLPRGPYFWAELSDECILTRNMKHFPIHYAREVFCSENLLNCDEKIDWRDCKLNQEEENKIVQEFREGYQPFDVTDS